MLSAIHETTAAAVLTVVAADELASSCASSFGRAGATGAGTLSGEPTGEPTGELGWPSSVSVSRELFSAFSTSSLSAADLSGEEVCCPISVHATPTPYLPTVSLPRGALFAARGELRSSY